LLAVAVKDGAQIKFYNRNGVMLKKSPKLMTPPIRFISIASESMIFYGHNDRIFSMYDGVNDEVKFLGESKPVTFDTNSFRPSRNKIHFLTLDEQGVVKVWYLKKNRGTNTHVTAINAKEYPITDAKFDSMNTVLIVYGNAIEPTFESITYFTNKAFIPEITVGEEKKKFSSEK